MIQDFTRIQAEMGPSFRFGKTWKDFLRALEEAYEEGEDLWQLTRSNAIDIYRRIFVILQQVASETPSERFHWKMFAGPGKHCGQHDNLLVSAEGGIIGRTATLESHEFHRKKGNDLTYPKFIPSLCTHVVHVEIESLKPKTSLRGVPHAADQKGHSMRKAQFWWNSRNGLCGAEESTLSMRAYECAVAFDIEADPLKSNYPERTQLSDLGKLPILAEETSGISVVLGGDQVDGMGAQVSVPQPFKDEDFDISEIVERLRENINLDESLSRDFTGVFDVDSETRTTAAKHGNRWTLHCDNVNPVGMSYWSDMGVGIHIAGSSEDDR